MQDDKEIRVMTLINAALLELEGDHEAIARVLRWAAARHNVPELMAAHGGKHRIPHNDTPPDTADFGEFADLYAAANPRTDAEKALVAAYWFQITEGQKNLIAQGLNNALKHLGHGCSNITVALRNLMERKPNLVMQVQKSGKTQQARKKYKLTTEGIDSVRNMVGSRENGDE